MLVCLPENSKSNIQTIPVSNGKIFTNHVANKRPHTRDAWEYALICMSKIIVSMWKRFLCHCKSFQCCKQGACGGQVIWTLTNCIAKIILGGCQNYKLKPRLSNYVFVKYSISKSLLQYLFTNCKKKRYALCHLII